MKIHKFEHTSTAISRDIHNIPNRIDIHWDHDVCTSTTQPITRLFCSKIWQNWNVINSLPSCFHYLRVRPWYIKIFVIISFPKREREKKKGGGKTPCLFKSIKRKIQEKCIKYWLNEHKTLSVESTTDNHGTEHQKTSPTWIQTWVTRCEDKYATYSTTQRWLISTMLWRHSRVASWSCHVQFSGSG